MGTVLLRGKEGIMRRITHRIAVSLAALGLAVTGVIGIQSTDEAQAASSSCPSGAGCIWVDADFKGRMAQWQNCINDFSIYGFDNQASSAKNRGNYDALFFYKAKNGVGTGVNELGLAKGYVFKSLGNWNNQISSAFFESAKKYKGDGFCN
jgi:hypothetical protein